MSKDDYTTPRYEEGHYGKTANHDWCRKTHLMYAESLKCTMHSEEKGTLSVKKLGTSTQFGTPAWSLYHRRRDETAKLLPCTIS